MKYRTLGRTGIEVSPYCLGTMMFGAWGNPDHDDSIRIIHKALDAGINFVDTADVYSHGESEEIVGKALDGRRRDDVVLAGEVRAIGASTFPASDIVEAHWVAERRGLERFRTEQPRTRSSTGASSARCCRSVSATTWGHWSGAR